MLTAGPKVFTEGNTQYRMTVTYGLDYAFAQRNNQAPYFSMTASYDDRYRNRAGQWGRWRLDAGGGAMTEEIARRFPALRPYAHWHLMGTDGPMHYFANAQYWWEMLQGKVTRRAGDPDPTKAFMSTVHFGALPEDAEDGLDESWSWPQVHHWLAGRLPSLVEAFEHDMRELGVWKD